MNPCEKFIHFCQGNHKYLIFLDLAQIWFVFMICRQGIMSILVSQHMIFLIQNETIGLVNPLSYGGWKATKYSWVICAFEATVKLEKIKPDYYLGSLLDPKLVEKKIQNSTIASNWFQRCNSLTLIGRSFQKEVNSICKCQVIMFRSQLIVG